MMYSNHSEWERKERVLLNSASFGKHKLTQKPCQDIAWERSTGTEAERSSRKKCPSSSCEMTPITHLLPVHPTRDCKGVICKHKRIEEEDYGDNNDDDDGKDKRAHKMTNPSFTRWFCSSKKTSCISSWHQSRSCSKFFQCCRIRSCKNSLREVEEGLLLTSQLPEWDPWPPKAGLAKCLSLNSRCWRSWSLSLYR